MSLTVGMSTTWLLRKVAVYRWHLGYQRGWGIRIFWFYLAIGYDVPDASLCEHSSHWIEGPWT